MEEVFQTDISRNILLYRLTAALKLKIEQAISIDQEQMQENLKQNINSPKSKGYFATKKNSVEEQIPQYGPKDLKPQSRVVQAIQELLRKKDEQEKLSIDELSEIIKTQPQIRSIEETKSLIQWLSQMKPFIQLNQTSLGEISDKLKIHNLPKETIVTKQNTKGDLCYILLSGKLDVIKDSVKVFTIEKKGSIFGELALDEASGGIRTATIMTVEETVLCSISKYDYKEHLQKQTYIANIQKTQFLRSFPLCQDIPQNKLLRVFYSMVEGEAGKSACLFKQQEKLEYIYFIVSGKVTYVRDLTKIERMNDQYMQFMNGVKNTQSREICKFQNNQIVGFETLTQKWLLPKPLNLYTTSIVYSYTCLVTEKCVFWKIKPADFVYFISQVPQRNIVKRFHNERIMLMTRQENTIIKVEHQLDQIKSFNTVQMVPEKIRNVFNNTMLTNQFMKREKEPRSISNLAEETVHISKFNNQEKQIGEQKCRRNIIETTKMWGLNNYTTTKRPIQQTPPALFLKTQFRLTNKNSNKTAIIETDKYNTVFQLNQQNNNRSPSTLSSAKQSIIQVLQAVQLKTSRNQLVQNKSTVFYKTKRSSPNQVRNIQSSSAIEAKAIKVEQPGLNAGDELSQVSVMDAHFSAAVTQPSRQIMKRNIRSHSQIYKSCRTKSSQQMKAFQLLDDLSVLKPQVVVLSSNKHPNQTKQTTVQPSLYTSTQADCSAITRVNSKNAISQHSFYKQLKSVKKSISAKRKAYLQSITLNDCELDDDDNPNDDIIQRQIAARLKICFSKLNQDHYADFSIKKSKLKCRQISNTMDKYILPKTRLTRKFNS